MSCWCAKKRLADNSYQLHVCQNRRYSDRGSRNSNNLPTGPISRFFKIVCLSLEAKFALDILSFCSSFLLKTFYKQHCYPLSSTKTQTWQSAFARNSASHAAHSTFCSPKRCNNFIFEVLHDARIYHKKKQKKIKQKNGRVHVCSFFRGITQEYGL